MAHAGGLTGGAINKDVELYQRQFIKKPELLLPDYRMTKTDMYTGINTVISFFDVKSDSLVEHAKDNQTKKLERITSLQEKNGSSTEIDRIELAALKSTLLTKGLGFNLDASRRSLGDEASKISPLALMGILNEVRKSYGLNCSYINHFMPPKYTTVLEGESQSKVLALVDERRESVGSDLIIVAHPYEILTKQQAQMELDARNERIKKTHPEVYSNPNTKKIITENYVEKPLDHVQFNDGENIGEKVSPRIAFYSMMVAKGLVTLDQLETHGTITFTNLRPQLEKEVEFLEKSGVKKLVTPPTHIVTKQAAFELA